MKRMNEKSSLSQQIRDMEKRHGLRKSTAGRPSKGGSSKKSGAVLKFIPSSHKIIIKATHFIKGANNPVPDRWSVELYGKKLVKMAAKAEIDQFIRVTNGLSKEACIELFVKGDDMKINRKDDYSKISSDWPRNKNEQIMHEQFLRNIILLDESANDQMFTNFATHDDDESKEEGFVAEDQLLNFKQS